MFPWLVAAALAVATPAIAGADRFVVDLAAEPSSLDPQVQWNPDSYYVYRNIFDNLVTRDDKGEIVPQVATAWNRSPTPRSSSRSAATSPSMTARSLRPRTSSSASSASPTRNSAARSSASSTRSSHAVPLSPTEVKLVTDGPYPALLAQLVKLSIVPKTVVEAVGKDAFNLKPVGSGPYKFEAWQRGVAVTLSRNDAYWGAKGPFPTALFRAVPDAPRVSPICRPAPPILSSASTATNSPS